MSNNWVVSKMMAVYVEAFRNVPVLICSGYLVDLTAFEEETGARPDGFVQKPYKMETMASTVREVINEARRAAA